MKQINKTLFVTSKDIYLSVKNGSIMLSRGYECITTFPFHWFNDIISFSYSGASPALIGMCLEHGIHISFCDNFSGKFLYSAAGNGRGNILVRREQYRIADDASRYVPISRNMTFGKLHNSRYNINRMIRDHKERVDTDKLKSASDKIQGIMKQVMTVEDPDILRGLEASAASIYFGVLDDMLLGEKPLFSFSGRNRRPPLDPINAMLSYGYKFLESRCSAALFSYGLDAYAGFSHRDRPGRKSLALDLMEEFRPVMVDRLVLTLVNRRQIKSSDFVFMEGGAVSLSDSGKKVFISGWEAMCAEEVVHPFTGEKVEKKLLPFVQAGLLARFIRGEMEAYPPFLGR